MSSISAGTTSGTALVSTADTTGALVLQTNGTTTAVTIATNQVVTLAQPLPVASGGTGATSLSGITVGTATTATTATSATTATNLAGGSNGTIPYQSAAGTTQMLAAGTAGQLLQTNGAGAPTWVTVASGLSAATQAEMETATSNTVAVTPLSTNWHPGVAKCWGRASYDGTTLNASHNVTSITDAGTGQLTVTIATDFSSQYYSVCAVAGADSGARMIGTNNVNVGTFALQSYNDAGTFTDPGSYSWACFGDQ